MKNRGFTLVELVTVIILLGIIAAITAPRFFDNQTFTDSFNRSELASALAWTRNRTVTSQCSHEVRLTTTGWTVYRDVNCSSTAVEAACATAPLNFNVIAADSSGANLTGNAPTVGTSPQRLIFTATGLLYLSTTAPSVAGCTTLAGNPVAGGSSISLNPSGTLVLDGDTAYVAIQ